MKLKKMALGETRIFGTGLSWYKDAISYLNKLKPLKDSDYTDEKDAAIKEGKPVGFANKKLIQKGKIAAKHLKILLDAKENFKDETPEVVKAKKALEKMAVIHKEIGGLKRYDYQESDMGHGMSAYSIFNAIWHGALD